MKDAAIVGFAETKIVERSERDVWELGAEVLETLLDTTGFELQEIDGLALSSSMTGAGNPFWSQTSADFFGLELDFCQTVDIGGSSPLGALARATAAIDAGLATTVFCLYADTQVAENNSHQRGFQNEWTTPLGYIGPPTAFGLLSQRYEYLYGLDYAALGKLAVAQRAGAVLNANACEKLRKPITVDNYLNSRMIADPIRLLDCVMVCDGASGLLVTSRARAKSKGLNFVVPIGYGERTYYRGHESIVDVTQSGHVPAAQKAFKLSGLKASDIASFHPYDDFIIAILLQLEAIGFCSFGEGCAFIRDNDFSNTGNLPLNTGGGQISAGQCGLAGGGTNLIEAVRQLFGKAGSRQLKNTSNGMVTGIGGIPYGRNWGTSTVMIMAPGA